MGIFNINIDTSALDDLGEFGKRMEAAVNEAAQNLAAQTYAKAIEIASQKLHSRRQMFIEALSQYEEDGVHVINLEGKAVWIDEGMSAHSLLPDLLASDKAKTAKDGSKFTVVPFSQGPGHGPTNTTPPQLDLVNAAKNEMKAKKIPWAKVERDEMGRPLLGKLHSFNVMDKPIKTKEGPGQGKGPLGAVRQGPTGIPFLQGVNIYQKQRKDGSISREAITFRIASSKHADQGRWWMPELEPTNIFEETHKWALETMEKEIIPDIIKKLSQSL